MYIICYLITGIKTRLCKCSAPHMLVLKKKCLVILLRNLGGPFVNGLQGTVAKLGDDGLTIRSSNGTTVAIPKSSFDVRVSFVSEVCSNATSVQYPMKLAYTLTYTVHKTIVMTSVHCSTHRRYMNSSKSPQNLWT